MSFEEEPTGGAFALITPPKDPNELKLPAANPIQNSSSVAPLRYRPEVLPHSPVKTTVDSDLNFEPLPYSGDNAERSISPIFWQLVCSPLKATTNADDATSPPKERDSNQIFEKQPSPLKELPESILSNDFFGSPGHDLKTHETKTHPPHGDVHPEAHPAYPHHTGWPMYPPPPYFWYQQYPYGYHHPSAARDGQQNHPRHSFPPLYPKSQHGPYYHPYHLPPRDQFGNPFMADHPQLEYITEVTVNDVICGRGGAVNNHPGNRRFRKFIHEFKHQYMMETKQSKPSVAMRVLEAVKNATPPGRFLVKYPRGYLECGDDRAREKASQALREGAAKLRKQNAKSAGEASVAGNDAAGKPAPALPDLDYPKVFEPPRKKIKEEPVSD